MQLVVRVTCPFLLFPNIYFSFQIPNRAIPFLHSYSIWIIRYLILLYETKDFFPPFSLYRFVFEYHYSSSFLLLFLLLLFPLALQPFVGFGFLSQVIPSLPILPRCHFHHLHIVTHIIQLSYSWSCK